MRRLDRVGLLVTTIGAAGLALPFVAFRENRIVPGVPIPLPAALPAWEAALLGGLLCAAACIALASVSPGKRLAGSLAAVAMLALAIGDAARLLTPPGDTIVRVAPGAGFWLLALALLLMASDAVARWKLAPWPRLGALAVATGALGALLWSGLWDDLSVMREYANRADTFWREAGTHLAVALGSLAAAVLLAVPIGILCSRLNATRDVVLNTLTAVQTIPSIALFGLLIAPMAWLAATVPGAAAIGIAGIGAAPGIVALVLYGLLPLVANTMAGLDAVPPAANDAARGMGMSDVQRLVQVELPLAFPAILAATRIVLVQNIGLATVVALIGGGGLGTFVFQGAGQTAMDLVLLGAAPTVVLAAISAIALDAAVDMASGKGRR
ncbi:MAG: ABC transporter permease [Rhizobiaceae bacterium]